MKKRLFGLPWTMDVEITNKPLSEICREERERTIRTFGRLFTEEEVVRMVEEAKEEMCREERMESNLPAYLLMDINDIKLIINASCDDTSGLEPCRSLLEADIKFAEENNEVSFEQAEYLRRKYIGSN